MLQFIRFIIVGASNAVVSFVAYKALLALSVPYPAAAPLSFAAGAVNGYIWNRMWTFAARDTTRARLAYVAVQVFGAVATTMLVVILVHAGVGRVEAFIASVPPVTVCMFIANRFWTFREFDAS